MYNVDDFIEGQDVKKLLEKEASLNILPSGNYFKPVELDVKPPCEMLQYCPYTNFMRVFKLSINFYYKKCRLYDCNCPSIQLAVRMENYDYEEMYFEWNEKELKQALELKKSAKKAVEDVDRIERRNKKQKAIEDYVKNKETELDV